LAGPEAISFEPRGVDPAEGEAGQKYERLGGVGEPESLERPAGEEVVIRDQVVDVVAQDHRQDEAAEKIERVEPGRFRMEFDLQRPGRTPHLTVAPRQR